MPNCGVAGSIRTVVKHFVLAGEVTPVSEQA